MLTKIDLSQIRGVVHEEVGMIVDEKLDSKLKPIKLELSQMGQIIDAKLEKQLKPIKKDLRYLKRTVDIIVRNYDEADVKLHRRVKKIEDHIGLTL